MSTLEHVEKLIKDHKVEFVDLRFADMRGVQHHVTFPKSIVDASLFEDGKMFDGSSIGGWRGIHQSDMVLLPDPSTAFLDPFTADPTLVLTCDILDPTTMQAYTRDPRGIAKRAEAFLKSSGIADQAFFGPEPEFFIFDSVRYGNDMGHTFFHIDSEEAHWNSAKDYPGGNSGYRPGIKGGYFPVAPLDSLHDLRAEMCKTLEAVGIEVEVHHHEVANAGQCEIGTRFNTLVQKADELLTMKYVIKNVAFRNGKTATFMPKPIVGDNGSGMHVHQSLAKGGTNLFTGDGYGGLSQMALWYIGGIFKHARAINAFTNSTTNSYKRLVPHPVRGEPEGAPHRDPLPRPDELRLPDLRRADDGGPRRHQEPDRPRRAERQGPVRPPAGGGEEHPDRVRVARPGAGSAGQGPRLPQGRRRVHRRLHRRLHRPEDEGSHRVPRGDASARVPDVLRDLGTPPAAHLQSASGPVAMRA